MTPILTKIRQMALTGGLAAAALALPLGLANAAQGQGPIALDDSQLDAVAAGLSVNFDVATNLQVDGLLVSNALIFQGLAQNINPFTAVGVVQAGTFGQAVGNSSATSSASVVPTAFFTANPSISRDWKVGGIAGTISLALGFAIDCGLCD